MRPSVLKKEERRFSIGCEAIQPYQKRGDNDATAAGLSSMPWMMRQAIVEGPLNYRGGVLHVGVLAPIGSILVPLAGAAALFGYVWGILRHAD